jgi:two-component system chemotaxis response regulator CheB
VAPSTLVAPGTSGAGLKDLQDRRDIIVVGASAGGVSALRTLARDLPGDLPAAVFVVLHVAPHAPSILPEILDRAGALSSREPDDGETIGPGTIYVARPDHHLLLDRGRVRVVRGPRENGYRPSIDVLFRSAARAYGPRVIAVVLSGALDDGAAGVRAVKERGGLVVVQAPEEASYPDMPRAALAALGSVDYSPSLVDIPPVLALLSRTPAPKEQEFPLNAEIALEDEIAHGAPSDAEVLVNLGSPSSLSCPECGGVLWELSAPEHVRFRCQVGHAYSAVHLFHAQNAALQQSLWATVRGLREHALLARQIHRSATGHGWPMVAERFLQQAARAEAQADALVKGVESLGKAEERPPRARSSEASPSEAARGDRGRGQASRRRRDERQAK